MQRFQAENARAEQKQQKSPQKEQKSAQTPAVSVGNAQMSFAAVAAGTSAVSEVRLAAELEKMRVEMQAMAKRAAELEAKLSAHSRSFEEQLAAQRQALEQQLKAQQEAFAQQMKAQEQAFTQKMQNQSAQAEMVVRDAVKSTEKALAEQKEWLKENWGDRAERYLQYAIDSRNLLFGHLARYDGMFESLSDEAAAWEKRLLEACKSVDGKDIAASIKL